MSSLMRYHGARGYQRVYTEFKALTKNTRKVMYGNISLIDGELYIFDGGGTGELIIEETISRPTNAVDFTSTGIYEWDLLERRNGPGDRGKVREGQGRMFYVVHERGQFVVYHLKGLRKKWGTLRNFVREFEYSIIKGSLIEKYHE